MMKKHAEPTFILSDDHSAFIKHKRFRFILIKVSECCDFYEWMSLGSWEDQEASESVAGTALTRHNAVVLCCLQRNRVSNLQLQKS